MVVVVVVVIVVAAVDATVDVVVVLVVDGVLMGCRCCSYLFDYSSCCWVVVFFC
jgi:hypothetical protein